MDVRITSQLKKFLVPIDFSETSLKAVQYAALLGSKSNSEITLFHTVDVPIVSSGDMVFTADVAGLQKDAELQLESEKAALLITFPDLKISTVVVIGVAAQEILLKCKKEAFDMVIMGSNGTSGVFEIVFGSVTKAVISQSPCPVLTIPNNFQGTIPQKVAFATNFNDHELQSIFLLTEMLKLFNSEINLIHVGNGADMKSQDDVLAYFRGQVRANINYENIRYHLLNGTNVEDEIEKFVVGNKIDWLAIAKRKRNFFDKLTTTSLTNQFHHHSYVPLLVFHTTNQSGTPLFS